MPRRFSSWSVRRCFSAAARSRAAAHLRSSRRKGSQEGISCKKAYDETTITDIVLTAVHREYVRRLRRPHGRILSPASVSLSVMHREWGTQPKSALRARQSSPSGQSWISGSHFGDGCLYANTCDLGLFCVVPEMVPGCEDIACCSPYCDTTELDPCPGEGQECMPWYGEAVPPEGYEDVGICGVP